MRLSPPSAVRKAPRRATKILKAPQQICYAGGRRWRRAKCTTNLDELVGEVIEGRGRRRQPSQNENSPLPSPVISARHVALRVPKSGNFGGCLSVLISRGCYASLSRQVDAEIANVAGPATHRPQLPGRNDSPAGNRSSDCAGRGAVGAESDVTAFCAASPAGAAGLHRGSDTLRVGVLRAHGQRSPEQRTAVNHCDNF
jgi:hypothetical protein